MTPTAPPASPRVRVGGGARRIGLFALAFVAMGTVALASMVRFTGPIDGQRRERSAPEGSEPPSAIAGPRGLVIPVQGVTPSGIADSWGQSRAGGARAHQGTDIMAPRGTPVLAAAAGTIEKLFDSRPGGRTVYVRSRDGVWSYYYAHLAGYVAGLREGQAVRAGQTIAFVGDTGNAGAGNYHLHFGMARMRPGERWWGGATINPYPLLVGRTAAR